MKDYKGMKARGASPLEVYQALVSDTGDKIAAIKGIREVFGLEFGQVKELLLRDRGFNGSVEDHEARLIEDIEKVLNEGDENQQG